MTAGDARMWVLAGGRIGSAPRGGGERNARSHAQFVFVRALLKDPEELAAEATAPPLPETHVQN